MAIQWGYHFVTGLKSIDRQHESLVALVNKLEDAVKANAAQQELDATFQELADYARDHFALEEELMAEAGIPEPMLSAHKQAHQSFVSEITAMWLARDADRETTTHDLLEFLTTWVYRHILISDHEMARDYFKRKGMAAPPSLLLTTGGSG